MLILFQSYILQAMTMRTIVDVQDYPSDHSSSSQDKFEYVPVFEKAKKSKNLDPAKRKARFHEFKKNNPKQHQELNDKYYQRRRNDPIKRARDESYKKQYRSENAEKVRHNQMLYQRAYRQRQKEKKEKMNNSNLTIDESKKPKKRKRKYQQISSDTSDSEFRLNVKTRRMKRESTSSNKEQQTTSRQHVVARLKPSVKIIEALNTPRSPTPPPTT